MSRLVTACGLLFTVLGFALLVKLGLWQLDRAEEKISLMSQLEQRGQQQLNWPLANDNELAGFRLSTQGHLQTDAALLLDNQTHDGQVGYRLLIPLEVNSNEPWLLLDLGFVVAPRDRRQLPRLPELPDSLSLSGRLYQPGHNPLNSALLAEPGTLTRIQALEWPALTQLLGHELVPALLMLETPAGLGYPRQWQPINLSPEKHQAYALQWFSLAIGLLVVAALVGWKGVRAKPLASS